MVDNDSWEVPESVINDLLTWDDHSNLLVQEGCGIQEVVSLGKSLPQQSEVLTSIPISLDNLLEISDSSMSEFSTPRGCA